MFQDHSLWPPSRLAAAHQLYGYANQVHFLVLAWVEQNNGTSAAIAEKLHVEILRERLTHAPLDTLLGPRNLTHVFSLLSAPPWAGGILQFHERFPRQHHY